MNIPRPLTTATAPSQADAARTGRDHEADFDRYDGIRQYSLIQVLAVWLAATAPMAALVWIAAPWLSHHLGGREPLAEALLICFNAGLIWILALTLILVRRERGSLAWPHVRDALWLRAPRNPKSRRTGGKTWWWVLPFVVLSAAINALPIDPAGPILRDLPKLLGPPVKVARSSPAGLRVRGIWRGCARGYPGTGAPGHPAGVR